MSINQSLKLPESLDVLPDVFISSDSQWIIIDVRWAVEKIFWYTRAELIGKPTYIFTAEWDLINEHIDWIKRLRNLWDKGVINRKISLQARKKDWSLIDIWLSLWSKEEWIIACIYAITKKTSEILLKNEPLKDEIIKITNLIKESEARLLEAEQIGNTWHWVWDIIDWDLSWSQQMYSIFNTSMDFKVSYQNFLWIIHKDDRKMFDDVLKDSITDLSRNEHEYSFEHRIIVKTIRKDPTTWKDYEYDEIQWVHEKWKVKYDKDWKAEEMIWTVTDITDNKRNIQFQETSRKILEIALKPKKTIKEVLKLILDELLWIDWLTLQVSKGSIFIFDEHKKELVLMVEKGFPDDLKIKCDKVPIWKCHCGKAAEQEKLIFSNHVDHHHEILPDNVSPHWHYCQPIMHEGDDWIKKTLWVINLYLNHGHQKTQKEEYFLSDISNTVALIFHQKTLEEKLNKMAMEDKLTWIPNRLFLAEYLPIVITRAKRNNSKFSLFFIDLNKFKYINDSLWHNVWDEMLIEFTKKIKKVLRVNDQVFRIWWDEFVVILEDINQEYISTVTKKILDEMEIEANLLNNNVHILPSIWITMFPKDWETPENLLNLADKAMYSAKESWNKLPKEEKSKRGFYKFFDEWLEKQEKERILFEKEIKEAIERKKFQVYYQPQFDKDWGIVWAEALIRWHCEALWWWVSPDKIINFAEKFGFIMAIWQQVMNTVCIQLNELKERLLPVIPISVNISWKQLENLSFPNELSNLLITHWINPYLLKLEFTESQMLTDEMLTLMKSLKTLWYQFEVDDYGTWWSNLWHLRLKTDDGIRLFDCLKLDKSFIDDIETNDGTIFIDSIIAMAHKQDFVVIAEWVENENQVKILNKLDCDIIQGYFYSKPIPREELLKLLELNHKRK